MTDKRFLPIFVTATFAAFAIRIITKQPETALDYGIAFALSAFIAAPSYIMYLLVAKLTEPDEDGPKGIGISLLISAAIFVLMGFICGVFL